MDLTTLIAYYAIGHGKPLDTVQAACIAESVFFESRSESLQGQAAVAQVIINRARERNITPCEVVNEPYQFSYKLEPIGSRTERLEADNAITDTARYNAAMIAVSALSGSFNGMINGSTHYYNPNKAQPKWAKSFDNSLQIGDHLFVW